MLAVALSYLLPRSQVNSSVMALLPKEKIEGVPTELLEGFNKRLDQQLVWLISPQDKDNIAPVLWWSEQLQTMPEIAKVTGQIDANQQQVWRDFVYQYRYQLLDKATISRLQQGVDVQVQWILSQLYSPFSGVSAGELTHDPLLSIRSAQLTQNTNNALQLHNGWLSVTDDNQRTWYLLYGELQASSYNIQSAHLTVEKLAQLTSQLQQKWPDTQLLQRGTLFYSDYASQQAQHDINRIGVISALGIILLILVVFRSIKPLLLTLLSITVGILCGTVATLAIFGEIHVMTLVMSVSVVGISIDYALHYLTERMIHGKDESTTTTLKKLLPTLIMAVFSSALAYLMLLIAPFSGLQQLAIFAASGLFGAFLTVVLWYPFLAKNLPTRTPAIQTAIHYWIQCWQRYKAISIMLPLGVFILGTFGVTQLHIDDDIRKLQTLPQTLQQQEQQIAQLTQQNNDQKWFVVYADNAEQALQRLEQLSTQLDRLKADNIIGDYRALPLPSEHTQQQNLALVKQHAPQIILQLEEQLGLTLPETTISDAVLTPDEWLNSTVSDGWRLLWLSNPQGETAILVLINKINQTEPLMAISEQTEGVHWVDKHSEFSELFSLYRAQLSWLLVAAVIAISAVFFIKFKPSQTIRCVIPMLLSLYIGLAVLGLTGQPLNLFSLLALILVLGIGIDYTLFFSNAKAAASTLMLSVFMAALTTLLTFGLLALSQTQAIAGFGSVLIGGILTAFVLSPLAIKPSATQEEKDVTHEI